MHGSGVDSEGLEPGPVASAMRGIYVIWQDEAMCPGQVGAAEERLVWPLRCPGVLHECQTNESTLLEIFDCYLGGY